MTPSKLLRRVSASCLLAASALLAGCASSYVDTATREIPVSAMKKIAQPKPVQLVFEFQTKGAPNPRATEFLKEAVTEQVKASGLFSAVGTQGVEGGAMLNVALNNIPLTDNAAAQGFVTGLTFGLAGSAVTDGYVCTASYLASGAQAPLVSTAKHAIHTTMGNAGAPANAKKSAGMEEAIRTMTREVLSNALNGLALNPSFN